MQGTNGLAILAAIVIVVGGCGGSATAPPATPGTSVQPSPAVATHTPSPNPVSTPSLTPTPNPSAELAGLASQYTSLSKRGDAVLAQCQKDKAAAGNSLVTKTAAAQACLLAYDQIVTVGRSTTWGPVQPQADAVVAAMGKVQLIIREMASATDDASFSAAYGQIYPAEQALLKAANVLRAALGLPPARL